MLNVIVTDAFELSKIDAGLCTDIDTSFVSGLEMAKLVKRTNDSGGKIFFKGSTPEGVKKLAVAIATFLNAGLVHREYELEGGENSIAANFYSNWGEVDSFGVHELGYNLVFVWYPSVGTAGKWMKIDLRPCGDRRERGG